MTVCIYLAFSNWFGRGAIGRGSCPEERRRKTGEGEKKGKKGGRGN